MEGNIRAYVDELFAGTTPSRKAVELKEEMIQNLTDKYTDLIAEGKSPEASYNIAIASIGDVSGLLKDLEKDNVTADVPRNRQKAAMLTAIAVMIYILSVVPLIFLTAVARTPNAGVIGVLIMFVMVAAATGLLIYNGMTNPRSRRDSMVDDFKDWQAGTHEQRTMIKAISTALWTLTVAIYIIVSFLTGAWYLTWVIFLVVSAIQAIINAVLTAKKK